MNRQLIFITITLWMFFFCPVYGAPGNSQSVTKKAQSESINNVDSLQNQLTLLNSQLTTRNKSYDAVVKLVVRQQQELNKLLKLPVDSVVELNAQVDHLTHQLLQYKAEVETSKVAELELKEKNMSISTKLLIASIALCILFALCICLFVMWKKVHKKESDLRKKNQLLEQDINKTNHQIVLIEGNLRTQKEEYKKLLEDNARLKEQLEEQKNVVKPVDYQPSVMPTPVEEVEKMPTPEKRYADTIVNGYFYCVVNVPDEDSIYELLMKNNKSCEFTVREEEIKRVLRNPDFIDGCDNVRIAATPTTLEIVPGTAELRDDGKWYISKKATVRFV